VITRGGVIRALVKLTGIGQEGTRIRIQLRENTDVYRALEVLARWELELVSVMRTDDEAIFHVRGLEDKERLTAELKEALG